MFSNRKTMALAAGLMIAMAGCATPPSATPPPERPVRTDRGREFGKQFLLEARKQYRFVKDQEVVDVVNAVGRRLVTASGRNPDAFHFFIVKEVSPNAFAIPGGYIFIFEGLLTKLGSEDELAGVLAHEIAHVTHDHFFKDENKVLALDLATMAAILLARGQVAAPAITMAAGITAQLQFSRENEMEADASAIPYLKRAGYDPRGLMTFFQKLLGHGNINRVDMPAYLSTHPALPDRIGLVELRLDRPADSVLERSRRPVDWDRIQVIARARDQETVGAARLLADASPERFSEERTHYLSGLANLTTDRIAQAIPEYEAALSVDPENPVYHADLAMAYLKTQDVERARAEAVRSLEGAKPGEAPENAEWVLGMLASHSGNYPEAIEWFEKVVRRNPDHAFAHYHAGQAYFKSNRPLEAAYHTGRYLRLNLEPEAALREFRRAKDLAGDRSEMAKAIQEQIDQILTDGI